MPKKLDQVVGVVAFSLIIWRLPIVKNIPHQVANPFNAIGVILLRLALSFFVVMALNDRRARYSTQRQGHGDAPYTFRVRGHWLLRQTFSQTQAVRKAGPLRWFAVSLSALETALFVPRPALKRQVSVSHVSVFAMGTKPTRMSACEFEEDSCPALLTTFSGQHAAS